jgi:hypothetical protein
MAANAHDQRASSRAKQNAWKTETLNHQLPMRAANSNPKPLTFHNLWDVHAVDGSYLLVRLPVCKMVK